jgi:proteasome accessory factor B
MPRNAKVQRWTDLLAALLLRHYPVPFEELARDVPAYSDPRQQHSARMRMFERDKDELRAFGVPIETVEIELGETQGYRLAQADFYLPYLAYATSGGLRTPPRVDVYGYRALRTLAFEPDELAAIADAAIRLRSLREPVLLADVESATRKLAFDLPLDISTPGDGTWVASSRDRVDPDVFDRLSDALIRRKRVVMDYHALSSGETLSREVEPYGLFFLESHWYLVARDLGRDALRNFRVSRIATATVNAGRLQSSDYEIPDDFDLREHARSRRAWELGDASAQEAVVEFVRDTGATRAAMALGEPVEGAERRRRFQVRRPDVFCRWILTFGGDARIVSPSSLSGESASLARETLRAYL